MILLVHQHVSASRLAELVEETGAVKVFVCLTSHAQLCCGKGCEVLRLADLWPVEERSRWHATVCNTLAQLKLADEGYFQPFDALPFKLHALPIVFIRWRLDDIDILFWLEILRRLAARAEWVAPYRLAGPAPLIRALETILGPGVLQGRAVPVESPASGHRLRKPLYLRKIVAVLTNSLYDILPSRARRVPQKRMLIVESHDNPAIAKYFARRGAWRVVIGPTFKTGRLVASLRRQYGVEPLYGPRRLEVTSADCVAVTRMVQALSRLGSLVQPIPDCPDLPRWVQALIERIRPEEGYAMFFAQARDLWNRLEEIRPSLMVGANQFLPAEQALLSWCRHYRIPTACMTGFEILDGCTPGEQNYPYDVVLTWSGEIAQKKRCIEQKQTRFVAVGAPRYQNAAELRPAAKREYVLIAPSETGRGGFPDVSDDFSRDLGRLSDECPSLRLMLRLHGLERLNPLSHAILERWGQRGNHSLSREDSILPAIRRAAVVITTVSTVAIDAMACQTPVIVINGRRERECFSEVFPELVFHSLREIPRELLARFEGDPSFRRAVVEKQRPFLARFADPIGEEALERIGSLFPVDGVGAWAR